MEKPSDYKDSPKKLRKDGKPYASKSAVQRYELKKQVKRWIMQGKMWGEVIELIMEKYGYSEESACNIYTECNKAVKEYLEKHKDDILDVQMARMEDIIQATFDRGDYNTTLKATEQLNKLAKLYETKVKVESDSFTVKIDGE